MLSFKMKDKKFFKYLAHFNKISYKEPLNIIKGYNFLILTCALQTWTKTQQNQLQIYKKKLKKSSLVK